MAKKEYGFGEWIKKPQRPQAAKKVKPSTDVVCVAKQRIKTYDDA